MTLTLTTLLVPFMFSIVWGIFILSESLVTMLVTLLLTSLILPLMYMEYFKVFWPCGLLLILMSTGLIVIFAYIVSLHSKEESHLKYKKVLSGTLLSMLMLLTFLMFSSNFYKIFTPDKGIHVSLMLSLILISLLLFLVVNFIRIVYSKGGGFRKKF